MNNVTTQLSADGKTLIIGVALDKPIRPTKGGKGMILGESVGFRNLPTDQNIAFNLMVYRRQPKAA